MLVASKQKLWIDIVFIRFFFDEWSNLVRNDIASSCHKSFPIGMWKDCI